MTSSLVRQALSLDEVLLSCKQYPTKIHVINFWASWADSCIHMNDIFAALAEAHPESIFWDADAEAIADLALNFQIEVVPTFIFVRGGQEVGRVKGAKPEELESILNDLEHGVPIKSLNDRLKELINRHSFMIFIKGTPKVPRCGFTRQLLEILETEKIDFDYFDILQDEEVRQGLKVLSDWPTYPQIYIKGELVGGLDIFKDLVNNKQQLDAILGQTS